MSNKVIIGYTTKKELVGKILSVKNVDDIGFDGMDEDGNEAYINTKSKNPFFTEVCILNYEKKASYNKNQDDSHEVKMKISEIRKAVRVAMMICSAVLTEQFDYDLIKDKVVSFYEASEHPLKEYCCDELYKSIKWDELEKKRIFREKEITEYIFDKVNPLQEKFKNIIGDAIVDLMRIREFIEHRSVEELYNFPIRLDNIKLAECIIKADITEFFIVKYGKKYDIKPDINFD